MELRINRLLNELSAEELFEVEGGSDCCVSDTFAVCPCFEESPIAVRYGVAPCYGIVVKYGVPPFNERVATAFDTTSS